MLSYFVDQTALCVTWGMPPAEQRLYRLGPPMLFYTSRISNLRSFKVRYRLEGWRSSIIGLSWCHEQNYQSSRPDVVVSARCSSLMSNRVAEPRILLICFHLCCCFFDLFVAYSCRCSYSGHSDRGVRWRLLGQDANINMWGHSYYIWQTYKDQVQSSQLTHLRNLISCNRWNRLVIGLKHGQGREKKIMFLTCQ